MDYAIEYALMGELYDTRMAEANEGQALDYIRTHHGIGKVGAALKLIWSKIKEILGRILSIIPRLILKLFVKDAPLLGSKFSKMYNLKRIGDLGGARYKELYTAVSKIARTADAAMSSKNLDAMTSCKNSMQQRLEEAQKLKDWVINYAGSTAKDLANKLAPGVFEGLGYSSADEAGKDVWDTVLSIGNFRFGADTLVASAKALQERAKKLESDPEVSEDFSKEALAMVTAFNQITQLFISSVEASSSAFNTEWMKNKAEIEKAIQASHEQMEKMQKEFEDFQNNRQRMKEDIEASQRQSEENQARLRETIKNI